jgi:hypothetical protein
MERLQHIPLVWLYLAVVAAGAVGGGLYAAVTLVAEWFTGRRT